MGCDAAVKTVLTPSETDASRQRQEVFAARLEYFVRMTSKGRRFGMVR
jgi:hypothetical protein